MTTLHLELIGSPSDSVREIETQDGAVLLDIRQGLCLSMTPVGIMIWRRLKLNQSLDQITHFLAGEFSNVPRAQIQDDVVQFVADIRQKGLLESCWKPVRGERLPPLLALVRPRQRSDENDSSSQARTPRALIVKALLGLLVFDLFGLDKNFARIHASVLNWPVAVWSASADTVERIGQAINYACVWYPKRVQCLQRSAVTTCLLRSCGVQAEMVLGAQKLPFQAHAWTEVGGRPVNERRDVQTYLIWDRC